MRMKRRINKVLHFYIDEPREVDVLRPMAYELEALGYEARFTTDFQQRSEVGIYACHANRFFDFETGWWGSLPSSVSIMCAHDLDQVDPSKPMYFTNDGWHLFDLALVPNDSFLTAGSRATHLGYLLPRMGLVATGWPPSDHALGNNAKEFGKRTEALRSTLGLTSSKAILLACSWSEPRHLAELRSAVEGSEWTIIARYPTLTDQPSTKSPWFQRLQQRSTDLEASRVAASKFNDVVVPNLDVDLYSLLSISELVVSNGSSVLLEGVLMGRPGISVTDWLLPDGPDGYDQKEPQVFNDGVIRGASKGLREMINKAQSDSFAPYVTKGREIVASAHTFGIAAQLGAIEIDALLRRI